ncbi:hypothetical protein QCN27_13265 [Cereibacter sp. SYSU M97828]|nr:hypothetical protein [Cereibacter flavus]
MSCDPADIDLSSDLLSLLAVCTVAARHIAEGSTRKELAADLHRCMLLAEGLAQQTHQAMSFTPAGRTP